MMAAAAMLCSCNKELQNHENINPATESVELEISVSKSTESVTRSVTNDWKDTEINDLSVYVFNDDGSLDVAEKVLKQNSIKLSCLSGKGKSIYALVNFTPMGNISTKAQMDQVTTALTDNGKTSFVMSGCLNNQTITNSGSISIPVSRSAAKVSIDMISNKITDLNLKDKEFKVKNIYLINVPCGNYPLFSKAYKPSNWCNKMIYETDPRTDLFTYDAVNSQIINNGSYTKTHTFFSYPNPTTQDANEGVWSARKTRLVVETQIGTDTYYYPITLDALKANTHYHFKSLTITRKGSLTPDTPVSSDQATFNVVIEDWTKSEMGDVTI